MSRPASLIQAILRRAAPSEADASAVLAAAATLAVDPLEYCTHRFGLSPLTVTQRAAGWAGLGFTAAMPEALPPGGGPQRIDALAEVRTCRVESAEGSVLYCAPTFEQVLRLRELVAERPELAGRIRLVTAATLRSGLVAMHAERLLEESRQRLARLWPFASAHLDLSIAARLLFVAGVIAAVTAAALAPFLFKPLFMPLVGLLLVVPAAVRLIAAVQPADADPAPPPLLDDEALPVYSVLIPLRDEAQMVPLLERALLAVDYPPEKLDVKFVVESRSAATVAAVRRILQAAQFELVVVPDGEPRTKPKALNYALPLVRGEYVVVYDAEDIPAPQQLRQAASVLAAAPDTDCLQAELVPENATETWLTALFAGEYAGQFGLLLPFLARLRLPMPLGGTSNHFRTQSLREIGGWDAFNVTEDADLGVRLSRLRYRATTMPSQTLEEAPISLVAWMAQRTRWMKGWMQTFIVHNRSPRRFLADIGWRSFLAFEIYVGGMIVSGLLHSVFLASFFAALLFGFRTGVVLDVWDLVSIAILLLGYGGAIVLAVAGLLRLGRPDLLAVQVTLPIYWVLHSFATLRALHELLVRPYFWAKTAHGRTRMARGADAGGADEAAVLGVSVDELAAE